jgi:lincosamide nucleotidyltransferase A/C/D/E
VLQDWETRRIDLHFYERLDAKTLQYGSVSAPFVLTADDLSGRGSIAGLDVRCESPGFALRCHTGYEPRDFDRQDVSALCERFDLPLPDTHRWPTPSSTARQHQLQ